VDHDPTVTSDTDRFPRRIENNRMQSRLKSGRTPDSIAVAAWTADFLP
jgi:hypothetical protein